MEITSHFEMPQIYSICNFQEISTFFSHSYVRTIHHIVKMSYNILLKKKNKSCYFALFFSKTIYCASQVSNSIHTKQMWWAIKKKSKRFYNNLISTYLHIRGGKQNAEKNETSSIQKKLRDIRIRLNNTQCDFFLVESSSRNNSHSCQMKLSLCDDNKDLSQDDALRMKLKRQRRR